MPKEVVQYPTTDGFSGTEMSVHWSKEDANGFMQIGLTRHVWGEPLDAGAFAEALASPIHADHQHCNECALVVERNLKRQEANCIAMTWASTSSDAPPVGEFDPPSTVFTQPMTRTEVNKLIRVLRRARDQAFGRDE